MMPIRAVLFDLDGTLLDRRETFRRHLEFQIARHPLMFPNAQAAAYVAQLAELDENGMLDRAEFYDRVEREFGLARGSAAELSEDFEVHFPESCVPFPNLFEMLQTLRDHGLKLGLVTNGRELIQGRKVERLGIRPYLDAVVISETVGTRKPDPRIFSAALAALGVEASATAFVGDNPEADVLGAKRSGLLAVWKRDSFWPEPAEADWIIDDLAELPAIVLESG